MVDGLVGCTSVSTVSEQGACLCHHLSEPSFDSNELFRGEVLDPLARGEGQDMPSPFDFTGDGQIFSPQQDFTYMSILTPRDRNRSEEGNPRYPEMIEELQATSRKDCFASTEFYVRDYN